MKYKFAKRTMHMFKEDSGHFDEEMINQLDPHYIRDGICVPVSQEPRIDISAPIEPAKDPVIQDRIEDIIEDLKDDGKLNHSNNPKKKSPGRPKKKKGFFGKRK